MTRSLGRAVPAALFLFLFVAVAQAQTPREDAIRRLSAFIESEMKAQRVPGLSIAVVHGDFTWSAGFGYADLENQVPARADSSYRMASVSKPMTAAAVMRLVEQGKIDLDAEVQTYVPEFPRKPHPVTVRQLLQHLGGISHYKNYDAEGHFRDHKTTKQALDVFKDFDLVAEPGTRYQYSSYGYNLLGAVVEGACKCRFGDFMTREVWSPLGMTASRMEDPRAIIPNRVRGYTLDNGKVVNSEYVDISSRFGGGGSRSTVGDMMKFVIGVADGKLLKRESVEAMWTSGVTKSGSATRYGFGFSLIPQNGRFHVAHNGAQAETRTELAWFPSIRFGYAIASNFEDIDMSPIIIEIARAFLGDSWNLAYYVPGKHDASALLAMGLTWNNGLGWFDRHRAGRTESQKELSDAFAYFNRSIEKGDNTLISQGRHPSAGEAYIKAGAYMAAALAKSGKDLETYHREGELAFFDDYIRLYRASRSIPRAYRFDPAFEKKVAAWRSEWPSVWQDDAKTLHLSNAASLDRLAQLAPRFRGRAIVPNYIGGLIQLGETTAQAGQIDVAMRVGSTLLDLYPESADANAFAGVMQVMAGKTDEGRLLLAKSRTLDPTAYGNDDNLEQIAQVLERMGNAEAAKVLREVAVKPAG
jgi:CubicO group peptidase (beta-lactamase class C family)